MGPMGKGWGRVAGNGTHGRGGSRGWVRWEGEVEVWVVEGRTKLRRSLGLDLTRLLEEETSFDIPDGTLT
jgi:hypothetical protein